MRFVVDVSHRCDANLMSATCAPGGTCACVSSDSRSTTPIPREPQCARQHDHRPISARGGVREDDKHTRRCSQAAGVLLAGSKGFLVPLGVPNGPCSPRLPSAPQHVRGGDRALSRCWAGQQVVAHRFRSMLRTSSCRSCRGWLRPRLALGWPRLALRRGAACRPFIGVSAAKTVTGASVAGVGGWPAAR